MNPRTRAAYTSSRPDIVACVPPTARRLLDVGCSNGSLGAALRAEVPGRTVWGIEADPAFCAEAATRIDRVIQADLNGLAWTESFADQCFDAVIFADVLEHLTEPWTVLRCAVQVLSPGGVAVISVPNIRHVSAMYSIAVRGHFPRRERGLFDKTHLRWFTFADAVTLCRDAGLEVDRVVPLLRLYDWPGGRANERIERLLGRFRSAWLVREFLAYQFLLTATKRSA
jgi:methionine biosynthesis protein MetW